MNNNKNKLKKINKKELLIYIVIIMLTIIIYLINFTTIGIDLGFNVKPSVLVKKDNSYQYQNLCDTDTRPIENYKCRTNKKILKGITIIDTSIFRKNQYLRYFPNISTLYIIADDSSLSKKEILNILKYVNKEKIVRLYIDRYSGNDLEFLDDFNNLDSLTIISAKNLTNLADIKNLDNLEYISINDNIIRSK